MYSKIKITPLFVSFLFSTRTGRRTKLHTRKNTKY